MSDLPKGWELTTLGELAPVSYGKGLSAKQRVASGNVPVVGSAGVAGCHTEALVDGPSIVIGRKGNAGTVWLMDGPSWPIDTTYFMRVPEGVDPAFLAYELDHIQLGRLDSSTAMPSLRREDLESCPLRIPPQGEQERIVAAIEEYVSRLDAAQASVDRASLRLSGLIQGMMAAAFDREFPMVEIGQLAAVGSGATPKRTEGRYWDGGEIPWVTSGALNCPRVTEASAYVTPTALAETSVKLWPAGTVLVAMYGEGKTRGRAAELAFESTCNQACAAIRPDPTLMRPPFLRWFLNSRYQQHRRLASGGVQPNLSLGLVKAMKVPVPSLEQQDTIVEGLESSMEIAHCLDLEIANGRSRARTLRMSILGAAFSGHLVPQDPDEEPASVLLERFRAERATATWTNRTRKARAS